MGDASRRKTQNLWPPLWQVFGCGSKLNRRVYAGFLHLPGFHFGTGLLSHSHLKGDQMEPTILRAPPIWRSEPLGSPVFGSLFFSSSFSFSNTRPARFFGQQAPARHQRPRARAPNAFHGHAVVRVCVCLHLEYANSTCRQPGRQAVTEAGRQRDRELERRRQTEIDRDRERDRERERERARHTHTHRDKRTFNQPWFRWSFAAKPRHAHPPLGKGLGVNSAFVSSRRELGHQAPCPVAFFPQR